MARKGLTPIIAVVLLLMMTVAATGLAYRFVIGAQSDVQDKTKTSTDELAKQASSCIRIEYVKKTFADIRNCGSTPIGTNALSVYVDDIAVNYTLPRSIDPQTSETLFFDGHYLGTHRLKVTMANGISDAQQFDGGYALSFDGEDDLVLVPHSASFDSLASSVTIEMWVSMGPLDTGYADQIIGKGSSTSAATIQWYYFGEGDPNAKGLLTPLYTFNGVWAGGGGTFRPVQNRWYHVAMTHDGNRFTYYVDGQVIISQAEVGTIATNTQPLMIGRGWQGSHATANAKIDDVRIYRRALNQAEIVQNMYGNHTTTDLLSYWSFDDIKGCNVPDITDTNNGQLQPNCPESGTQNHPTIIDK